MTKEDFMIPIQTGKGSYYMYQLYVPIKGIQVLFAGGFSEKNYKSKFEKLLKYRRRSNQINGKFAVKMFVISFTCNY